MPDHHASIARPLMLALISSLALLPHTNAHAGNTTAATTAHPVTAATPARIQVAPTQDLAKPCDDCVPGVINFAKISDALWRGAQPTAEGFKAMEAMGLKTVINFRHNHDDLPLIKDTRLKYLHIPSFAFHPTEANLLKFLKVVENPDNWPVYIHCAQGRDRTGYNAAAYRMLMQKWSGNDAILEMNVFRFNQIWVGNPGFIKEMNMQTLAEKLKLQAKPKFLSWQD